ncbi:glycoside hydrolase family 5 protein [Haloprofundus sp. MHR1]|uniref:glycoside hydrolase family 5 protein n=1 Tax=Haloprofundus sp. MHR1 TaxID=2572921 RepID=UPI0010BE23DD|nr:glycoside hydrolase family 5 protein [Haloprofundus sp. MHR1]QCJ46624.1 glycoside hydrolase family 5 protein [Haloprofundus sp. MHR1]
MTTASDRALSDVRGAVYVPARAFNAYQFWEAYDPDETERDFRLAKRLNRDALRLFLSYEYWFDAPEAMERRVDNLLSTAEEEGLRIVPILFESAGEEPTRERRRDRDPHTACAVRSPSHDVINDESRWSGRDDGRGSGDGDDRDGGVLSEAKRALGLGDDATHAEEGRDGDDRFGRRAGGPREYVEWFVDRYGDDDALLALEIMNEPGDWDRRLKFARRMLRVADDNRADVPLTMGCKGLRYNALYDDPELDVFQFHLNLPPTAKKMEERMQNAREFADDHGRPVWLTEWQRTRKEPPNKFLPNYASLAGTIRDGPVDGDFFWSLMLKPAYLPDQREKGRINGVFHRDGSVYSGVDARALAGDDSAEFEERRRQPSWLPADLTRAETD